MKIKPIPVTLNNVERYALWDIASKRNKNKVENNVQSQKFDPNMSDMEMHYVGLKAEYACAKLLGLEMDIRNTLYGDPGYDLVYGKATIDVKFSTLDLKYRLDKKVVADIIILTQPLRKSAKYKEVVQPEEDTLIQTKPRFRWAHILVIGWISRGMFNKKKEIMDFGHGPGYVVLASEMEDMRTLRDYITFVNIQKTNNVFS